MMPILWLLILLAVQRLLEVALSRRNRSRLLAAGGREFYPETFARMAALHGAFLLALTIESYPWRLPANGPTILGLAAFFLLEGMRLWCIASLGHSWNTRIVLVPGGATIRRGPYRWLRHPNYLVVALEFVLLPLLLRAWWTLALFPLLNLLVLRQRIRLEEAALREFTDYAEQFP